jgi:hypothetical protein
MTAESMRLWLSEMGISAAEGAKLLGVHPNTMTKYKTEGAPVHIALACAALYHRIKPWA